MTTYLTQRVIINIILKCQPQIQFLNPALRLNLKGCWSFAEYGIRSKALLKKIKVMDHTCEISNYDEYLVNHRPTKQIIIETLQEVLNITTKETKKILKEYPLLMKKSRATVLTNYYNLLESGINKSNIANNVWLLTHDNDKLKDKLNSIKILNMNNDHLILWLHLTHDELKKYIYYTQKDMNPYTYNKMEYLAIKLECSIQELCKLTLFYSFLLKISVSHMDKVLNILHEYNISNKKILQDLYILKYSEKQIRSRCELFKDTGNSEIKTWAIRCDPMIIKRAIEKNNMKRGIMRHYKNISEYLLNKLKVNEETLNVATAKYPGILKMNIAKMDQIIDILHQNGITSDEILQNEYVFHYNLETIKNRIKILKKKDIVPRIPLLLQRQKTFKRRIERQLAVREIMKEHTTLEKYIINKLNIDEKICDRIVTKHPKILRINIEKLSKMIDILQQYGVKGDDIMRYPYVLSFSVETISNRLETLVKAGLPIKVHVIVFSTKSFNTYVRHNKNKNNNI